jgi:hypothetical protein
VKLALSNRVSIARLSIICAIVIVGILVSQSFLSTAATPTNVRVTISANQSLDVIVPSSSNLTLLSVTGGQYNLKTIYEPSGNELTFSPSTNGTYSVLVNVSSVAVTGILIEQTTGVLLTLLKNVTASGVTLLNLSITVLPPSASGSTWNALSGFIGLGFSFGGVNLSTSDFLAIFLGFSLLVMGLGVKYNQKLLFVGLIILSLVGIATVGILGVAVVAGGYVSSFFAIRYYYRALDKRQSQL